MFRNLFQPRPRMLAFAFFVLACTAAQAQEEEVSPPAEEAAEVLPAPEKESVEVLPLPPLDDAPLVDPDEALTVEEVTPDEVLDPVDEAWWGLMSHWEASFELGLNASQGNNERFDSRVGFKTKRKTPNTTFKFDVDYRYATQDSVETAQRLFTEAREELHSETTPWSAYVHGAVEFDRFRAFDSRVILNAGGGYQFLKTDITSLKGRVGAGSSREFGGPQDEWAPEGVFGFDYERKLTRRQKFTASSEFYFDMREVSDNRINTKANWEVILDEEAHLSLKLGVINRYDSTPNGVKPNDLDYSAVLLWTF